MPKLHPLIRLTTKICYLDGTTDRSFVPRFGFQELDTQVYADSALATSDVPLPSPNFTVLVDGNLGLISGYEREMAHLRRS